MLVCSCQEGLDGASVDIMEQPSNMDLTGEVGFALALNSILRLRPGGVVAGLCCESFSMVWLVANWECVENQ